MFHTPAGVTQGWHSRLMGSQGLASDSGSSSPQGSSLEPPPLSAGVPSALGSLGTVLNLLIMWAGNHDPIAPLGPAASCLPQCPGRLARIWTMEHIRGPRGARHGNAAQCTRQTMLITFFPLKATCLEFLPGWDFVSVDFQCVSSGPVEAQPQCSVNSQ